MIVIHAIISFSTNQTWRQGLEKEEVIFNINHELVHNMAAEFLKTGNVTVGEELLKLIKGYVAHELLLFYFTQNLVSNIPIVEEKNMLNYFQNQITEMEKYLIELRNVLYICDAANGLYENVTNLDCNITETGNSSSLQAALEVSKQLEYFQNIMIQLENKWKSCNMTSKFAFPWIGVFGIIADKMDYIEEVNSTIYHKECETLERLQLTDIFKHYIYPVIYGIILIIGTIGNGTLFLIFIRHKEIRTSPNMMVLNLAISDVLNLFVNAPVYYMVKYHNDVMYSGCKAFAVFRFLTHALIEISVVAISGQRYFATVSAMNIGRKKCTLSTRARTAVHIIIVWVLSLIMALFPVLFVFDFPDGVCYPKMRYEEFAEVFYISTFLFDCVILPVSLLSFSLLTARLLKKSAREIPSELRNCEQELARYKSARIVTALAIAYIVCFTPRCVLSFIVSSQHLETNSKLMIFLDEITNYLIFSNSCLNPIALYMASRIFRNLYNSYLFPCYIVKKNANGSHCNPESRNTSEIVISG